MGGPLPLLAHLRKFLSMYVSSIDNMRQGKDELGYSHLFDLTLAVIHGKLLNYQAERPLGHLLGNIRLSLDSNTYCICPAVYHLFAEPAKL